MPRRPAPPTRPATTRPAASRPRLSRRDVLLGLAAGTAVAAGTGAPAGAAAPLRWDPSSVRRATAFLAAATDGYPASNPGVRLAQSYSDENGLFSTAFVYDNALAVNAWLSVGTEAATTQAALLGDGLLYAQDHDPGFSDGRLRQAYNVGPYVFYDGVLQPDGFVRADGTANVGSQFGFLGTAVGDMAWPGVALAQLHARTGEPRFRAGAVRIGEWIVDRAFSDQPLGGFRFGVDGADVPVTVSSTEHNLDCISFFTLLHAATGDSMWTEMAEHAAGFVDRMWSPENGFFWTGTNDGVTLNTFPVPLDPQTWGWLVLRDERASAALDFADRDLRTVDRAGQGLSQLPTGVSVDGVTFSTASLTSTAAYNGVTVHPDGVWLEGTCQLATAWADRGERRDRARVVRQLAQVRRVQRLVGQGQHVGGAELPAAGGVVAASSLLDTGFGFGYFQSQHVGATAWYVMAALATNPYAVGGLG